MVNLWVIFSMNGRILDVTFIQFKSYALMTVKYIIGPGFYPHILCSDHGRVVSIWFRTLCLCVWKLLPFPEGQFWFPSLWATPAACLQTCWGRPPSPCYAGSAESFWHRVAPSVSCASHSCCWWTYGRLPLKRKLNQKCQFMLSEKL